MEPEPPITELVERLRAGDARAAELLFACYARRLTAVAAQHLSRRLAPRLDGEDVVQSVFRTFFRRVAGGEYRIDGSNALWRLLVKITLLKTRAKGRFHTAGNRSVGVEIAEAGEWLAATADSEPTPDDAVAVFDQIEVMLQGLPDLYADVLRLRLEGHDVTAIAAQLNVSRRTIQRALNLLQGRLVEGDPSLVAEKIV